MNRGNYGSAMQYNNNYSPYSYETPQTYAQPNGIYTPYAPYEDPAAVYEQNQLYQQQYQSSTPYQNYESYPTSGSYKPMSSSKHTSSSGSYRGYQYNQPSGPYGTYTPYEIHTSSKYNGSYGQYASYGSSGLYKSCPRNGLYSEDQTKGKHEYSNVDATFPTYEIAAPSMQYTSAPYKTNEMYVGSQATGSFGPSGQHGYFSPSCSLSPFGFLHTSQSEDNYSYKESLPRRRIIPKLLFPQLSGVNK